LLKLEDIHASYGRIEALRGMTLEIGSGEIVCLIGSNGAGKSTTLMTISGVLKPSGGRISFAGKEVHALPPHKIVAMGLSQVPEGRRIFPKLTVMENLDMGAFLKVRSRESEVGSRDGALPRFQNNQLEYIFSLFPVLKERRKQPGGTLSGGEQQMLAIGRALMSRPKLYDPDIKKAYLGE